MKFPKPRRFTCESFLQFIRKQVCVFCGKPCDHAHHMKTRGAGGSDLTAVPLCAPHHTEIHQVGKAVLTQQYGIDWNRTHRVLLERFIEEHWSLVPLK